MSTVRSHLPWFAGLLWISALGCDGGGGGEGGTNPFGSHTPKSPSAASSEASNALTTCGASCSADVAAGRAALAEGDLSAALTAYECANTPEAAFGAGLTTLLAAAESEHADRVLADFGIEPFPASDLIGADGYLSRQAERWNGGGSLTLSGALTAEVMLTDGYVEAAFDSFGSSTLSANGGDTSLHVSVDVFDYTQQPVGEVRPLLYDCDSSSGFATLATQVPSIYIALEDADTGRAMECSIAFSLDASFCQRELGSIVIDEAGTQVGEGVSITLDDVTMSCFVFEGPGTDTNENIVFSGTIAATVAGEVDTSDLHFFLNEQADAYDLGGIPEGATVNDLLAHATALTGHFAKASCLFERASDGSGEVFSVPGALFGGQDIAVDAADAKLLASLAAGGAAALQLGGAYASELPLREVACMLDQGESDSPVCQSTSLHVTMVNAAFGEAGVRSDRLAAARVFLAEGLAGFRSAAPRMDEGTIFPRNASSAAGWDAMVAIAAALEAALDDGEATLPFVSPSISMQLGRLLSNPPSPQSIQLAPLSYEEDCDDFDCYSDLELSPTYFSLLWAPLGVDFDGDYETDQEGESIEDAFEAFFNSLEARGAFRGSDF